MGLRHQVRVDYELETAGALHVGSGYRAVGYANRLVLRDTRGLPYVPGSSLKGVLRAETARLAECLELRACTTKECRDRPCAICQIFGSTIHPGPLRFSDARLAADDKASSVFDPDYFEVRHGVAICRVRRVAQDRQKYETEFARPGARLNGAITGSVAADAEKQSLPSLLWLLLGGLRLTDRVGGNRTRGAGRVAFTVTGVTVDGVPCLSEWQETLQPSQSEYLLLALYEEGL